MRKLVAFTLSVLLVGMLVGCGPRITEDEVYSQAIDILRSELEDRGYYGLEFSTQALSTIEQVEEDVYVVTGSVFDGGYGSTFTVKMHIDKGDWVDYEWSVD